MELVGAGCQLVDAVDERGLAVADQGAGEQAGGVRDQVVLGKRIEVVEPHGVALGRGQRRRQVVERAGVGLLLGGVGRGRAECRAGERERAEGGEAARHLTTRNAPRMNGWMRQKYVYVPGARLAGVFQFGRLAAAVSPVGPYPSSPESKSIGPSASG